MADKSLEAYEKRALEAEKHISILSKKLEEIEAAQKAQRQAHAVATEVKGGDASGDVIEITKARDEAVKENKQLKLQIEKLNYRILHLKNNLEEEEKKNNKQ